jgi:hypothetical protein
MPEQPHMNTAPHPDDVLTSQASPRVGDVQVPSANWGPNGEFEIAAAVFEHFKPNSQFSSWKHLPDAAEENIEVHFAEKVLLFTLLASILILLMTNICHLSTSQAPM